ncbi:UDP-glucuronosyltransferase 2B15 [Ooceraea biroi]|uniref:UDP-glucuronosyltransferase n=1 Tax=Ooceraea biroi TaxID=2015173 RepID=A0A026WUV4_OOCBI|nr:UDP-glucuronosyltransferase 2B15 [Ooceraea biroi]
MLESLMKGLANKGHQIDVISPYPQKKPYPNYTDIAKWATEEYVNNVTYEFVQVLAGSNPKIFATLFGSNICEAHLGNPVIQKLVRDPPKDPPYDAMIMEVRNNSLVLMKGLISKGHQVDIISPFPQKKPYSNYTDIANLTAPISFTNNMTYEFIVQVLGSIPWTSSATSYGNDICEAHLGNPVIQKLVRDPPKDPPYDAMIMEVFGAHCFTVIADLLNISLIGVSTTTLYPWLHELIAQPENLAFVPNNRLNVEFPMNLWQRTHNVFSFLYSKLYFNYHTRMQDDLVRMYFGPNLPSVQKMKLALFLVNSHIALHGIQPMTPAVIQIGGIHIRDDDSLLPQELKKWLDDSKDGFVYFTFGSMVLIETFPRKILDVFYASLDKIAPVRVLMKVPNPKKLPAGLPKNIRTFSWLPQLKVLKHPNIRAFITHGGLMSILEAIFCGVPMIGVPLFADQFKNVETSITRNVAVKLDVHKVTVKDMDAALNAILHDPRYM